MENFPKLCDVGQKTQSSHYLTDLHNLDVPNEVSQLMVAAVSTYAGKTPTHDVMPGIHVLRKVQLCDEVPPEEQDCSRLLPSRAARTNFGLFMVREGLLSTFSSPPILLRLNFSPLVSWQLPIQTTWRMVRSRWDSVIHLRHSSWQR